MPTLVTASDAELLENRFLGTDLGSLFHSAAYHRLHAGDEGLFFEWAVGGQVQASIHFSPGADGLWRSPSRGTFAGYAWREGCGLDSLFAFHDAVMARLAARGARRVEILTAPMAHDAQAFSQQSYLLRSRGFHISRCDLNQNLVLDQRPFAERISYGNLKRLRKCEREGVVVTALPIDQLPAVYETLAVNRAAKGHSLSMSLPALADMAAHFPGVMQLFGCQAGAEQAAAALCLRLSEEVMYVFYWGDRPGYGQLSPVVLLADAIYSHCRAAGIVQLDVGTSTVDAEPNFGLLQFKRGLGFTESLKLQFSKDLA
jgi:hypothetical protein